METITLDVRADDQGNLYYVKKGKPQYLPEVKPEARAALTADTLEELNRRGEAPAVQEEVISRTQTADGQARTLYEQHTVKRHWGAWSLLPAVIAVLLCFISKEPVTALLGGIVAGAFLLGRYDITDEVLVPQLATSGAAGVLLLYLWLLGGLMGIWTRTGAAQAFAEFMTRRVVRGPRSAKLTAWMLGVIFFQGGTVSAVLVGTTVKPIADKEKISHEELSYIVDSTSSPIASQLAFNAWPGYVQAFIFVAGVPFLLTEADRIGFFFASVPFCFYAIFAVLSTFLLSIDRLPFMSRQMRTAVVRARETGQLDAPDANPLSAKELQSSNVPEGYQPHIVEFFLPLGVLIAIAIGTFISSGSPQVRWAFGIAFLSAMFLAMLRGMSLHDVMTGVGDGMKGVVLGSVILLLAITIGGISKETGGATYLVALLGHSIPYWILPVILQLLTIIIAFSTGTSWGTYAVAFPLAMPLAWAVAQAHGLDHPQLFMTICFAAVMDGSVYGDQCSPISDTTVLSSTCTGCDLMDHVKTQIPHASIAAGLAAICWTTITFLFV
ncbi:MAG: sodium:proton antiporter [Gammaproteobacteria bacterium]|nr:sodium:proton antiporter [Gammaproteobacteria bacterium]